MRILFNTSQIHLHGGIEKAMAIKANYLADLPGIEVYILTIRQEGKPPRYPLNKKIHLVDLGISYNLKKSFLTKENIRQGLVHFKKQKRFLNQLKPDVIISTSLNFNHYWLPFIKKGSLLIKERHNSGFVGEKQRKRANWKKKLYHKLNDWIDSKYNYIVVLNEDEKQYVRSNNAIVIPNPILPKKETASLLKKKIMAAGRIAPVKAFDHLIKAWALITDKLPEWQLHIYGENYLNTKEELQSLIKNLKIEDSVIFKESVADLPETMLDYSAYAMTSETECFPMVLLEALSVGLPIISYDCPHGPRNILGQEQGGILIPNKDIERFAGNLLLLARNRKWRERLGKAGKERSNHFYVDSVMEKWKDLLQITN